MSSLWRRFVPPPQQNNQGLAIPSEVNAVARTAIDFQLGRPFADRLDFRGVSVSQSSQANGDNRSGLWVQGIEPIPEWACACFSKVFLDLYYWYHIRYRMGRAMAKRKGALADSALFTLDAKPAHPAAFRSRADFAAFPRNSAINTGPSENSPALAFAVKTRR